MNRQLSSRTKAPKQPPMSKGKARQFRAPNIPIRQQTVRPVRRITSTRIWQVAGVIVLGQILAAALTNPWLNVRNVSFSGLANLTRVEAATVRSSAQLPSRTNIFRAPTQKLEASLRQLPFVAKAEVSRRLPGTLQVALTLRKPVAILEDGDVRWELDSRGTVIRLAARESKLPVISLDPPEIVSPGHEIPRQDIRDVLLAMQKLISSPGVELRKIEIDQNRDICLNMKDNLAIHLGQSEDIGAKMALVSKIYRETPSIGETVQSIDLRSTDAPACTLRVASTGSK